MSLILGASLACLVFGVVGSANIIASTYQVKNVSYPVLDGTIRLSEIVGLTQQNAVAAIEETDEDVLIDIDVLAEEFESIAIKLLKVSGNEDIDLVNVLGDYKDYYNLVVYVVKKYLKTEDVDSIRDEFPKISTLSASLNEGIADYRELKYRSFNKSLDFITAQSMQFRSIFSIAGFVLVLLIVSVIILLFSIMTRIKGLVELAKKLATGDLEAGIRNTSVDELGVLLTSFDIMRISLKDMIDNLDKKVKARTSELHSAQKEIQDILDSIDQGIFTFNKDLSVNAEHSVRAESIFGLRDFGESNIAQLFGLNAKEESEFTSWITMMVRSPAALRQWETYCDLSPVRELSEKINGVDRIVKIEYRPIIQNQNIGKFQVLASDITEQRTAEVALEKLKREQAALTSRVLSVVNTDMSELKEFIQSAQKNMEEITQIGAVSGLVENVQDLFRKVHTLKGHGGTLGFQELALLLGRAEGLLDLLRNNEDFQFDEWKGEIKNIVKELENIIDLESKINGKTDKDVLVIDADRYERVLNIIHSNDTQDIRSIYQAVYELNSKPLESYCQKYKKLSTRFSLTVNKQVPRFVLETPDVYVHRNLMRVVDPALIHLFRNAIDHGIESDDERERAGKLESKIAVGYRVVGDNHVFTISDDGRGIDGERLAKKVVANGLMSGDETASLSHQEKVELVFVPGFSTRDTISDISGRGVGLDAVKNIIVRVGGTVLIGTEVGVGTRFTLSVPLAFEKKLEIPEFYVGHEENHESSQIKQ